MRYGKFGRSILGSFVAIIKLKHHTLRKHRTAVSALDMGLSFNHGQVTSNGHFTHFEILGQLGN